MATFIGTNNPDFINGTNNNDLIYGLGANDTLSGNGGADIIYSGTGNDLVRGNAGADVIYGEAGNDKLYGDAGADLIAGGTGNDTIDGGAGNDNIFGGENNDLITPGLGTNNLNGGSGNDYFSNFEKGTNTYDGFSYYSGWDTINDDCSVKSTLDLSNYSIDDVAIKGLDTDHNGYFDALKISFANPQGYLTAGVTILDYFDNDPGLGKGDASLAHAGSKIEFFDENANFNTIVDHLGQYPG